MITRFKYRSLRGYIFETIVIFLGITFSFIFDQWRLKNAEESEIKNYLGLVRADIEDLRLSDRVHDSNDSTDLALFSRVRSKTISKPEFIYLVNRSRNLIEYSTTSFSIIHISKSNLFEKLTDQQTIVALIQLINENIERQTQLRQQLDRLIGQLTTLPKLTYLNLQFELSDTTTSTILDLEISDDDFKELLNDEYLHKIANEIRTIRLQDRLIRKQIIKISLELDTLIVDYLK